MSFPTFLRHRSVIDLFIFVLLVAVSHAQPAFSGHLADAHDSGTLEIHSDLDAISINEWMSVIHDEDRQLTYQDIVSGRYDDHFDHDDALSLLGHDLATSNYWVKVKIDFGQHWDQEWRLVQDFNLPIGIWSTFTSQGVQKYGVNQEIHPSDADPIVHSVSIRPVARLHELIMRIDGAMMTPSFSLMSAPVERAYQSKVSQVMYLMIGIFLALLLYNLFVFFSTGDRNFLVYSFLILTHGAFYAVFTGVIRVAIPGDLVSPGGVAAFLGCSCGTMVFVFLKLTLDTRKHAPHIDYLLSGLALVFFGISVFALFLSTSESVILVRLLVPPTVTVCVVAMATVPLILWKKAPNAKYYLAASLSFMVGVLSMALTVARIIPEGIHTAIAMPLGSSLEMLFYGYSLFDRTKNSLEARIDAGLGQLREKHKDIQAILSQITQGIITITRDLKVHHEYSNHTEAMLGTDQIAGRDPVDVLFGDARANPASVGLLRAALHNILDESHLSFAMNSHHLPKSIERSHGDSGSTHLELDWQPIMGQEERVTGLMVTIRDVSEIRMLRAKESQAQEKVEIISKVVHIGSRPFREFCQRSLTLIDKVPEALAVSGSGASRACKVAKDYLHTVKGNALTFGFQEIADLCHECEELLWFDGNGDSCSATGDEANATSVRQLLAQAKALIHRYLDTHTEMAEKIGRPDQNLSTASGVALLPMDPNRMTLGQLVKPMIPGFRETSRSLGKAAPKIEVRDRYGREFAPRFSTVMADCLNHLIRNSIDHGFEDPERRVTLGKPLAGIISLDVEPYGSSGMRLVYRDDGQGLDLAALQERCEELWPHLESKDDSVLADLIFRPEFSTKQQADLVSGRGAGMSAVRNLLQENGGSIAVRLDDADTFLPGRRGFHFVIEIPASWYLFDSSVGLPAVENAYVPTAGSLDTI